MSLLLHHTQAFLLLPSKQEECSNAKLPLGDSVSEHFTSMHSKPLCKAREQAHLASLFWSLCIASFNVSSGQHPICFINWPMISRAHSPRSRLLEEQHFHSTNDGHRFHPQCPYLMEPLAKTAAAPEVHNHPERKVALAGACRAARS